MKGVERGAVVLLPDNRRGVVLDRAPDWEWWVMPDGERSAVTCSARRMRPAAMRATTSRAVV